MIWAAVSAAVGFAFAGELDRAEEFWLLLGSHGTDDLKALRHAIKQLADPDTNQGGATVAEKVALPPWMTLRFDGPTR